MTILQTIKIKFESRISFLLAKQNYFRKFLYPSLILVIYLFVYQIISGDFLPRGVNFSFTSRTWKLLLILCAGSLVFYFFYHRKKRSEVNIKQTEKSKFLFWDLLLLLLPLTPISQYIIKNQSTLSILDSIILFLLFAVVTGIIVIVIPLLLSRFVSPTELKIVGLLFVFFICIMPILSQNFSWLEYGSLKILLPLFSAVLLITYFLYASNSKRYFLLVITLLFLFNTSSNLIQFIKENRQITTSGNNLLLSELNGKKIKRTPNIYLLIYDAYAQRETMEFYKIDNSNQEKFLVANGFNLYPNIYSLGAASIDSMSKVLNASNSFYGNRRRGVSGDGIVQNTLSKYGYSTIGIFPYSYFFYDVGTSYDLSYPEINENSLNFMPVMTAILVGEFRFEFTMGDEKIQYNRNEFMTIKNNHLGNNNPTFLYSHSNRPKHSQNSGTCLPNEIDLYQERLNEANLEMKQDVNAILNKDPDSIIIIAGDHGPYLTKNCFDLTGIYDASEIDRFDMQDRFGTFLAIRWPTDDFDQYDDITILQDVFPAVFSYLFEDTSIIENCKVESKTNSHNTKGVYILNGTVYGGIDDGEPLFLSGN